MTIQENIPLAKLSTMNIGGPARYFVAVKNTQELEDALSFAKENGLHWHLVGEGSNIIPADEGFNGLIIKSELNSLNINNTRTIVGAGHSLSAFVRALNEKGLSGMERMAGIPGTVGGAIYGNAGAYGQEIKDTIVSVRYFNGEAFTELPVAEMAFGYRTSMFEKRKDWTITEAVFELQKGEIAKLQKISDEIIKTRQKKYKPGIKCPGSFFKNIVLANLPEDERVALIKKVPKEKIVYGKIPSGYLLEAAGARNIRMGGIAVADFHGNLIYNTGTGTAADVKALSQKLKALVREKFGIELEEEVQYL